MEDRKYWPPPLVVNGVPLNRVYLNPSELKKLYPDRRVDMPESTRPVMEQHAFATGRRLGKSALAYAQLGPSEHVNDPILRGVAG